jgi:hypothetical protein
MITVHVVSQEDRADRRYSGNDGAAQAKAVAAYLLEEGTPFKYTTFQREDTRRNAHLYHPADKYGNVRAISGCDRCECGNKYWGKDVCYDCGAAFVPPTTIAEVFDRQFGDWWEHYCESHPCFRLDSDGNPRNDMVERGAIMLNEYGKEDINGLLGRAALRIIDANRRSPLPASSAFGAIHTLLFGKGWYKYPMK